MNKIAIFGVPRSGTTWLAQIFNSHPRVAMRYQPLFSYGHKGALQPTSNAQDIDVFFHAILNSADPFATLQSDFHRNQPTFAKEDHIDALVFKEVRYLEVIRPLLEHGNGVKVVGIVRNPLAVLSSWIQAPKEFDPRWDILQEWKHAPSKNRGRSEEYYGFARWIEATELFLRMVAEFPNRFTLIRYSDLLSDTVAVVDSLFGALGLPYSRQTHDFLAESRNRQDDDPYSVYKIKLDDRDWENHLPGSIVDEVIRELSGSPLQSFL